MRSELRRQPALIEEASSVGRQSDGRTDFTQLCGLLVDVDTNAVLAQCDRKGQPSNACTDDRDATRIRRAHGSTLMAVKSDSGQVLWSHRLPGTFWGAPSTVMVDERQLVLMRSVATSLLLFVQTLIGNGLGPSVTGFISDRLAPSFQQNSLRYALVIIGVVNIWAALHYVLSSRTVRQDLEATEKLAAA